MDHRRRCIYHVAVASRISFRSGSSVGAGGKGRHVRKVMFALGDDLVHPAFLEWSGICASRGEESRDNNSQGLDTRHDIFFSEKFEMSVGSGCIGKECGYCERVAIKAGVGRRKESVGIK